MVTSRTHVAARLDDELTSVVAATVTAIRAEVPAYRDLGGPQLADVDGIARWSLTRLIELWAGEADVDDHDRAVFRAIGAARAADGRPLIDILRAYRVASTVLIRHISDTYLEDLQPVDIADLAVIVLRAVDGISEEIIGAYTAVRDRLASDRGRARAAFLDDLLAGRHNSPGTIAERCRELDLAVGGHVDLLVIEPVDPIGAAGAGDIAAITGAIGPPHAHAGESGRATHVWTRHGSRIIALLPGGTRRADIESVCAAVRFRGCLVTGRPVTALGSAHRLVGDALDAAPARAFERRALLDDGDAYLLALLTSRPSADAGALISAVLGPLLERSNRHLLDGVGAFIATGTASAASRTLGVHPQTLRYRMRRATQLVDRDVRRPWDRFALDTALQLRDLAKPLDAAAGTVAITAARSAPRVG